MTPGRHIVTIRVDNSIKYNVGNNAHSISDHTQSNWNGLTGRLEVRSTPRIWIEDVKIFPEVDKKNALLVLRIGNQTGKGGKGNLILGMESTSARMSRLARQECYLGDYMTMEESLKMAMGVRSARVMEEAERLLDSKRFSLTVVGPASTDFPSARDMAF